MALNFRLHGTVAQGSPGNETKEDFVTQELPVPLLGMRLHYPLTDRLSFFGELDGGYLPWVSSGRGGSSGVDLTQSHLDVVAGLRYALLPSLDIEAGPQFSYFRPARAEPRGQQLHPALDPGRDFGSTVLVLSRRRRNRRGGLSAWTLIERFSGDWASLGVILAGEPRVRAAVPPGLCSARLRAELGSSPRLHLPRR